VEGRTTENRGMQQVRPQEDLVRMLSLKIRYSSTRNSRKFRLFLISEHISRFRQSKRRIRWFRQQAYGWKGFEKRSQEQVPRPNGIHRNKAEVLCRAGAACCSPLPLSAKS